MIAPAPKHRGEWPDFKSGFRIVITTGSKPDKAGRQSFTVFWWQGERAKAQCFFARVNDCAEQFTRLGLTRQR